MPHFEKGYWCDKVVTYHQDQKKKSFLQEEGDSVVEQSLLERSLAYARKLGETTGIWLLLLIIAWVMWENKSARRTERADRVTGMRQENVS